MRSLKTLRAAGIAVLLATGSTGIAMAADMLSPPPPPPMLAPPAAIEASSGFYLRGDIGVGAYNYRTLDIQPIPVGGAQILSRSLSNVGIVSIGAGYQLNAWLRGDITAEYRSSSRIRIVEWQAGFGGGNIVRGNLASGVFLANAYVDLGTWHRVTPFVGLGAGLAMMNVNGIVDSGFGAFAGGSGSASSKTQTKFAWALHAGAAYDLTANWKAEVAYRYTNYGTVNSGNIVCTVPCAVSNVRMKSLDSHDVKVGLRYLFADVAPIYSEGPLVRKY